MSWIAGVGQRVRELFSSSRLDADLDAELQQYFDHELSRQIASLIATPVWDRVAARLARSGATPK